MMKVARVEAAVEGSLALPNSRRFYDMVSVRNAFGFSSTFQGKTSGTDSDLRVVQKGGVLAYAKRSEVTSNDALVDQWKVFVGFAAPGTGNKDTYPHRIISTPFVGEPNQVSTETYLCIGPLGDQGGSGERPLIYVVQANSFPDPAS
ncbi:MAG: hypothetical protein V9E81_07400 [Marmoricola sp.]